MELMKEKVRLVELRAQYQSMHQLMSESILKEKDLQKRQLLREQYTEIGLKIREYTQQIKLVEDKQRLLS
jgi:hypothetical protein